ncbi:hypothetical protein [Singulisphaera acidiphila]|uniref:Uncharacterized protein n=1 Tax=Singulisphaera acidiphila (strain ATCC BAA-1392 / DSM 18658 / VKM B-2454 / MOB10) TaxID=886293 RepID=L0D8C3_SINAD|nr:hypothetical protein [Singulisphaera acidiphila]AGA25120.1 hypothetical protein Sinac_0709 [Singulisphaera acidiphila DSM 18658]
MSRTRMTTRGMLMAVACAAVTQATYLALLREEWDGNPLIGFLIVASCVVCLAAVAAQGAFNRMRANGGGEGARWKAFFKSLALAAVLIGVTDTVFIASYLLLSHGRWYVVSVVDGPRELNLAGIVDAAFIAFGVAFLLRRLIWPGERASAVSREEPRKSLGEDRSRKA